MGFWDIIFKKKQSILPCQKNDICPYEDDLEPERDIEGMPFAENDPRSCLDYGHVCPEFMEDFGLTVEDLKIRAIIHCGGLLPVLIKEGKVDVHSDEYRVLKETYDETIKKYPIEKYPKYY